jgi:hypothetical protein
VQIKTVYQVASDTPIEEILLVFDFCQRLGYELFYDNCNPPRDFMNEMGNAACWLCLRLEKKSEAREHPKLSLLSS